MALPLWLPHYHKAYGELDESIYQGLLQMGSATIDRLLAKVMVQSKPKLMGKKMNNTNLPVNRVIFSQNQTKTVSLKLNLC